jgi:hypothetical protein
LAASIERSSAAIGAPNPTQRGNPMFNANALATKLTNDGGFTSSLIGDSPLPGSKLFAVAYSKDSERYFPLVTFEPENLIDFIADHADALSQPGVYLGGWVDNGLVYLDTSIITKDEQVAIDHAILNDQIAYFAFEDMTSRYVQQVQH